MRLQSFWHPVTIYQSQTKHGTTLTVKEYLGRAELYLDHFPQSGMWYRAVWHKMLRTVWSSSNIKNILILGLGGGDIVKLLGRKRRSWQVDIVELESMVVEVAQKYFGIVSSNERTIYTADAKIHMAANQTQYGLVIVDLYGGDTVPSFVRNVHFLADVARALTTDGIALFNYASHSFEDPDFLLFEQQLEKVFSSIKQHKIWDILFTPYGLSKKHYSERYGSPREL